jgi:hypothetical protein
MDLRNKREQYALWQQGQFGNKLRTWNSLGDILRSGYAGKVTMRVKGTVQGKNLYAYEVLPEHVPAKMREWSALGVRQEDITFNENAPDELLLMQGYLSRRPQDTAARFAYQLDYSHDKAKMRDAMRFPKHAFDTVALALLNQFCDPSSIDDLMALLDDYPGHVIEFGAYGKDLGGCPRRNTVIWEVRNY